MLPYTNCIKVYQKEKIKKISFILAQCSCCSMLTRRPSHPSKYWISNALMALKTWGLQSQTKSDVNNSQESCDWHPFNLLLAVSCAQTTTEDSCTHVFANGQCDEHCDSEDQLFDGGDCDSYLEDKCGTPHCDTLYQDEVCQRNCSSPQVGINTAFPQYKLHPVWCMMFQ